MNTNTTKVSAKSGVRAHSGHQPAGLCPRSCHCFGSRSYRRRPRRFASAWARRAPSSTPPSSGGPPSTRFASSIPVTNSETPSCSSSRWGASSRRVSSCRRSPATAKRQRASFWRSRSGYGFTVIFRELRRGDGRGARQGASGLAPEGPKRHPSQKDRRAATRRRDEPRGGLAASQGGPCALRGRRHHPRRRRNRRRGRLGRRERHHR